MNSLAVLFTLGLVTLSCAQQVLLPVMSRPTDTCVGSGRFPNALDCSGYLVCASGQQRPFIRSCAPGTLFDAFLRECIEPHRVACMGRSDPTGMSVNRGLPVPTTYQSMPVPATYQGVPVPTTFQAVGVSSPVVSFTQVVSGTNVVPVRLFGSLLRTDQCPVLGQQMTQNFRNLAVSLLCNPGDAICTSNLMSNFPVFRVDCLNMAPRILAK